MTGMDRKNKPTGFCYECGASIELDKAIAGEGCPECGAEFPHLNLTHWRGRPLIQCSKDQLLECVSYLVPIVRRFYSPGEIRARAAREAGNFIDGTRLNNPPLTVFNITFWLGFGLGAACTGALVAIVLARAGMFQ